MLRHIETKLPVFGWVLFFAAAFFVRCANPLRPEGGPVDSIPPKLVSLTPPNFTTHFNAKKVYIEFDEYVQLNDVQQNVFISPELERRPVYSVKGRGVQIEFQGELDSATTYKIDFGNAIADNNEGNILRGFSYVFSTGDYIDSLVMSGQVLDALTRDSVVNALVLLYDAAADSLSDDSVLYNSRPLAIARTDSSGVFLASNLKPMDYRVYALKDDNGNFKYERGTDYVGFTDTVYNPVLMPPFKVWYNPFKRIVEATPQMYFNVFPEEPLRRQALSELNRPERNRLQLVFGDRHPKIERIWIDSVDMASLVRQESFYGDTIDLWIPGALESMPDTLKGRVEYYMKDSVGNDTLAGRNFSLYIRANNKKKRRNDDEKEPNPFSVSVEGASNLNPHGRLIFRFQNPLTEVHADRIELFYTPPLETDNGRAPRAGQQQQEQRTAEKVRAEFSFTPDSSDRLRWYLDSEWVPNARYEILLLPGTFKDIAELSNDSLPSLFQTADPAKYGKLTLHMMPTPDTTKEYIVQLLKGGKKTTVALQREHVRGGDLLLDYIRSGNDYRLRIIEDANGNGKWDAGDPVRRVQPERAALVREEDGGTLFEMKENWEIDKTIDLNGFFEVGRNGTGGPAE